MTKFCDFNWDEVAKAMNEEARLTSLDSGCARIYLSPYGSIDIYDNGGEVNLEWEYIQEIVFPLPEPESIRVSKFRLSYSVAYSTNPSIKEKQLGDRIKGAIDNEIKLLKDLISEGYAYFPASETIPEIRVIKESDHRYPIQTREPGKLWKTQQSYSSIKVAVEAALKMGVTDTETEKSEVSPRELASQWSDEIIAKGQPGLSKLISQKVDAISKMPLAKAVIVTAYILDDLRQDDYRWKCFFTGVQRLEDL